MVDGRIFAGLAVLLCGCGLFGSEPDDGIDDEPPITPPEGMTGERAKGKFNYFCVSDRDPACLSSYALPFPAAIAVGGRFGLMYATSGGDTLAVFSGSPARISGMGASVFAALVPGSTGMLAYDYPDDGSERIVDFLSLSVEVPETVVLRRNDADVTAMTLEVGDEALVIAVTRDFLDEDLAGTLEFEWTLEPAGAAEIIEKKAGGVRIRANGPGDATVTATLGELSASASIHVNGDVATTEPSTSEPTTGGTTLAETTSETTSSETTASTGSTSETGTTSETSTTSTGSTTDMTTGGETDTTGETGTTGTTGGLWEEQP